ncbi:MAG: T9SS type A sorting domain-containing protein [Ignavibacteriaceae bacterium]|nr:T9SS type A sorting domain-containing protein [Ignavibacteriaceae bacterium]
MIKNIFYVLAIFIFSAAGFAQNFTFVPDHTALTGNAGEEVVFDIPITNTSNQTITLFVCRKIDDLPLNWYSSMCFDQSCFPSFLDSVATTPDFNSSPLSPGETRDFSVHILIDSFVTGTGHVKLFAGDTRNLSDTVSIDLYTTVNATSVNNDDVNFAYTLNQNYPNPFNPVTKIKYTISEGVNSQWSMVNLKVYDILGNEVAVLVNEQKTQGAYEANFDATHLSSGVYFYKLTTDNKIFTKKMTLIK